MKKILLAVSLICFGAGFSQAQAQVNVGVNIGTPVYPVYTRTQYYPSYYRDHRDYDWGYWHDKDRDDRHDNGKHKGWYKNGHDDHDGHDWDRRDRH
jgi:hypothetical protein